MSMSGNMSKIPFDLSKLPIDKSRPAPMPSLQPNTDSKSDYKINDTQTATNCDNTLENPPKFEDLLKNPPKFEDLLKNPSALTMLSQSKEIFPPKDKDDSNMNNDIKKYIDAKFEAMNNNLLERIDKFEQETNRKLDLILQKLESR